MKADQFGHDPILVVEMADVVENGEFLPSARQILSAFGETFMEEGDDVYRTFYQGELPGELHGGDPVVVTIGGESQNFAFRIYDSGWTPVTGRHIQGKPEEVRDIDEDVLQTLLVKGGKI